MFYRFVFAFIIGIFVLSTSSFAGDVKLKTHSDSASYSVGYNVGKSVLNQVKFDSLDLNFLSSCLDLPMGFCKSNLKFPKLKYKSTLPNCKAIWKSAANCKWKHKRKK